MSDPHPGPTTPDPGPTLDTDLTAEAALRRIVQICAQDFADHLAQLMAGDDPEGPHGARVALRRLRSALTGLAPLIAAPTLAAVQGEARALFRTLGRLRDADILAQQVAEGAAQAALVRAEVRAALQAARADRFAPALSALFAGDGWQHPGRKAARLRHAPARKAARKALGRAWKRCAAHDRRVGAMSDAERHGLRKDMKSLRYQSEFFRRFWPGKRARTFRHRMERLQQDLGLLNDLAIVQARTSPARKAGTAQDRKARQARDHAERMWRRLRKSGAPFR